MPRRTIDGQRVFVAGHRGMVGSALVGALEKENCEIIAAGRETLDLIDQREVQRFLVREKPDVVVIAAAKVGGILANSTYPAQFLYDNLMIASNLIHAAHLADVNRLLFLGSSCIYPKFVEQPIVEDSLLTGSLEPTNQWYAIAKIAGLTLVQAYRREYGRDYISAMPTNLYGPGDNFDPQTSHVLPALIRKAHEAKRAKSTQLTIWGTGTPRREFLYSVDCAGACVHLLNSYSAESHINVGAGIDLTIRELCELVCDIVGFSGDIVCDTGKPDGTPGKLMDSSRLLGLGWKPGTALNDGIRMTYQWYLNSQ